MPDLSSIRRAYGRDGLTGVLTATWGWASRLVRSGRASPVAPAPSAPSAPSVGLKPCAAAALTAQTVDLDRANAFFEKRRAGYETLADVVAPYLPTDGVLFDVGANVGFFTKVLVERTGFSGRAHLFEPVPNLAELCALTADELSCEATVHGVGLSDADSHLEIFISSDGNLGWNTMVEQKARGKAMIPVDIEVARFDGLAITEVPDLVKIDVEGAEYLVLEGMLPSIALWSPLPVILCEIGWGAGHPEWPQELAAFDALRALGYETTLVNGDRVDVRDLRSTTDVLFIPGPRA